MLLITQQAPAVSSLIMGAAGKQTSLILNYKVQHSTQDGLNLILALPRVQSSGSGYMSPKVDRAG